LTTKCQSLHGRKGDGWSRLSQHVAERPQKIPLCSCSWRSPQGTLSARGPARVVRSCGKSGLRGAGRGWPVASAGDRLHSCKDIPSGHRNRIGRGRKCGRVLKSIRPADDISANCLTMVCGLGARCGSFLPQPGARPNRRSVRALCARSRAAPGGQPGRGHRLGQARGGAQRENTAERPPLHQDQSRQSCCTPLGKRGRDRRSQPACRGTLSRGQNRGGGTFSRENARADSRTEG